MNNNQLVNPGWNNTWDKNPKFRHDIIINDIIDLNKSGMTIPKIADHYGVSRHCIMNRFKKAGVKPINWRYKKGYYNHSKSTKSKIGVSNKPHRKGKSWEEIFGVEKATELRKLWSINQRIKFLNGNNPIYTPGAREKISEKAKQRCKNKEYLKSILSYVGQNKQEKFVEDFLNELGYSFSFVGDGKVNIDGKCPDFIQENKIVEYFGSYWHEPSDEVKRIQFFTERGYKVLVIWDYELKNLDELSLKIKEFCDA